MGVFREVFMGSFARMGLFTLTVKLATRRKQDREQEWHWVREECEDRWERWLQDKGCGQRRVM